MPSFLWLRRVLRSEEHTSELQSHDNLVCRLLLEKKNDGKGAWQPGTAHATVEGRRCEGRTPARPPPPSGSAARPSRSPTVVLALFVFFFNEPAPPEIYTLSLPAALPI